jgi:endoglucanase
VTATVNCPNAKKGDILVSWTPSGSSFATGYTVRRTTNGGTPSIVATVAATTTSYDDTTVAGATTYTYSVVATYLSWTSATASAAPATTARRC